MPTQTTNLGLTVYDAVEDKQVAVKDFIQSVAGNTNSNMTKLDSEIEAIKEDINTHKTSLNPHGITKDDVGLEKVPNYGVATKTQAESGLDDNVLMTPKKTADAIRALSAGGGETNVFISARNEFQYVSDVATSAIQLPLGNFNPETDLIELYIAGARLDKGVHFNLVNGVINLATELKADEPLTYVVEKTGYRYSDLVGAPDVVNEIELHNTNEESHPSIVSQLNQIATGLSDIVSKNVNFNGLLANKDLNTATDLGEYYCTNSTNAPVTGANGYLKVYRQSKSSIGYLYQEFVYFNGSARFFRVCDNGVWTAWKSVATAEKTDISLLNGWGNSIGIANCTLNGNLVKVDGVIGGGTVTNGTLICTLPFKPKTQTLKKISSCSTDYIYKDTYIDLLTNGNILISGVAYNTRMLFDFSFNT